VAARAAAAQPLLPNDLAGLCVDARRDAIVVDHVDQIVDQRGRWFLGHVLGELPVDVGVGYVARAIGPHGPHFLLARARIDEHQLAIEQWARRVRKTLMPHFPKFLAGGRIVGHGFHRAGADQLTPAAEVD
jgi:hypothetical protein